MLNETIRADPAYRAAYDIIHTLQQSGHECFLVGGCVRDMLLGVAPKDWDIVTSAIPEEIEALFPITLPVGKAFGVITVVIDGIQTQVATFRRDGVYQDGRRPEEVQFDCGVEEDVQRRDFTINGVLYDPIQETFLDLVGGREDLEDHCLRAIGNPGDRFQEDALRILRAVRFSTTLNFYIEPVTGAAIRRMAHTVTTVAWERISEELRKILLSHYRSVGIYKLDRYDLLKHILPEISALKGVEQPREFHPEGDVFKHTLDCLTKIENPTFPQALAMLLHDIGKPSTFTITDRIRFHGHEAVSAEMALAVCQRLKLSTVETEEAVWIVANHMKIKDVQKMRKSRLRRFMSEPHFASLLVVARADTAAAAGSREYLEFLEEQHVHYQAEPLRPVPLVRGQDLLDLKIPQGPLYGKILKQVEDAQLDGTIRTYEEGLALALSLTQGDEK